MRDYWIGILGGAKVADEKLMRGLLGRVKMKVQRSDGDGAGEPDARNRDEREREGGEDGSGEASRSEGYNDEIGKRPKVMNEAGAGGDEGIKNGDETRKGSDASEKSAGLVLFRGKGSRREYLLLLYPSKRTYWGLSKGHIESGESEEDAALREATEETALKKITLVKGFETTTRYFMMRAKKKIAKEVVFFLGQVSDGCGARVSEEHKGLCWARFDEAQAKLRYKKDKEVLRLAEEFLR